MWTSSKLKLSTFIRLYKNDFKLLSSTRRLKQFAQLNERERHFEKGNVFIFITFLNY
jgi:ABC-type uncharacterized transport system fused permease/ATPase subunit